MRSSDLPRGLPDLLPADAAKLHKGNMLADRAAVLLRMAHEMGLPTGEENPASSILWLTQQRRRVSRLDSAKEFVVDHCAFGTPYRARTRFVCTNVRQAPEFVADSCKGRGICSFSGAPR